MFHDTGAILWIFVSTMWLLISDTRKQHAQGSTHVFKWLGQRSTTGGLRFMLKWWPSVHQTEVLLKQKKKKKDFHSQNNTCVSSVAFRLVKKKTRGLFHAVEKRLKQTCGASDESNVPQWTFISGTSSEGVQQQINNNTGNHRWRW